MSALEVRSIAGVPILHKLVEAPPHPPVRLPLFDGFPYLVTRVIPNLNHHLLLPEGPPDEALLEMALEQTRWNRLRAAVVLAPDRALYVEPDLSWSESEDVPVGGYFLSGMLQPAWSLPPGPGLRERQHRLAAYQAVRRGSGYLVGPGDPEAREASAADLARLGGPATDGIPSGLARCADCGVPRGECLHPNAQYRGLVLPIYCPCENWNRCAACGELLDDERLNAATFRPGRGLVIIPGFCGLDHDCPQPTHPPREAVQGPSGGAPNPRPDPRRTP